MKGNNLLSNIKHGAIFYCQVPKTEFNPHVHHGSHYYIIVANDSACMYSPIVQAIPLTSNCNRRLPCQVQVSSKYLPKRSYALAEQLTILPRDIVENGKFCGDLSDEAMEEVERAIKIQLALS